MLYTDSDKTKRPYFKHLFHIYKMPIYFFYVLKHIDYYFALLEADIEENNSS